MSKWKVYEVNIFGQFTRWDGSIIEANGASYACEKKYILTKNDLHKVHFNYVNYYAVPEGWELPLSIKYIQPELF